MGLFMIINPSVAVWVLQVWPIPISCWFNLHDAHQCEMSQCFFFVLLILNDYSAFSLHQFHGDIIFVVHVVLLNLTHFSQSSNNFPFENRFSPASAAKSSTSTASGVEIPSPHEFWDFFIRSLMDIDGYWWLVAGRYLGYGSREGYEVPKGTLFSDRIGSFFYFTGVSMHSILYINETLIPNINTYIYITINRNKHA